MTRAIFPHSPGTLWRDGRLEGAVVAVHQANLPSGVGRYSESEVAWELHEQFPSWLAIAESHDSPLAGDLAVSAMHATHTSKWR